MTDREQINSLTKKVSDYADEIVALKQENNELKKQVAELEKPKKKRKFRAMTFGEFCHKHRFCKQCHMYDKRIYGCITPYFESNDPFRTKNGKYILVEVTNDA